MEKVQHTPGPWKLETQRAPNGGTYYRIYDYENAGNVIAQVIGDGRIEYHENARLIAAAPDLLTALENLLHIHVALVESGDAGNWDAETETEVIDARAAIAKAKGVQA